MLAACLLGRHILRRAQGFSGLRQCRDYLCLPRNSEVEQSDLLDLTMAQKQVSGLEVAMYSRTDGKTCRGVTKQRISVAVIL